MSTYIRMIIFKCVEIGTVKEILCLPMSVGFLSVIFTLGARFGWNSVWEICTWCCWTFVSFHETLCREGRTFLIGIKRITFMHALCNHCMTFPKEITFSQCMCHVMVYTMDSLFLPLKDFAYSVYFLVHKYVTHLYCGEVPYSYEIRVWPPKPDTFVIASLAAWCVANRAAVAV
jgi:hypothetical protein